MPLTRTSFVLVLSVLLLLPLATTAPTAFATTCSFTNNPCTSYCGYTLNPTTYKLDKNCLSTLTTNGNCISCDSLVF